VKNQPKCGHTILTPDCEHCEAFKQSWYRKVEKSGFDDIEDAKGELRQHNRRTIAFDNRDAIRDFFLKLDTFLVKTSDIPPLHRKILNLYTQGIAVDGPQGIAKQCRRHERVVRGIIAKYKAIILKS
jgi:hypothetical protein